MAVFSFTTVMADGSQALISITKKAVSLNTGDAGPAVVYNPDLKKYFVLFTDFDTACPDNQKLFGAEIDPTTGDLLSSPFAITPCSGEKISDQQVVYNADQKKYGIIYKSASPNSATIKFMTLDAESHQTGQEVDLANDPLSDPFENNVLVYDPTSNTYGAGYHEIIGIGETQLRIVYIDAASESLTGQSTVINSSTFTDSNEGVKRAQLIANENNVFISFELRQSTGSEIWGGFINPLSASDLVNYFRISPIPEPDTVYLNPHAVYNPLANQILVVYEKSHYQISTAALNHKIRGQKISSESGSLIAPFDVPVTALPPNGTLKEDAKFPVVTLSPLSDEYLIFFYGKRWINSSSNYYDVFLQRINTTDLSMITAASQLVESDIGTAIAENNSLRNISIAFNSINNQYLAGWSRQNGNDLMTQVWRYDNNDPQNLSVSNNKQDENKAIGTVFATLSADDPDPEDQSLSYALVSGTGSQDNSYFSISGNQLKVAKNLNYEAAPTRSVRIRATDSHGASVEKAFTLTINDINEAPSNITLSGTLSVEENAPAGTFTSTISASDEDNGDTHTYRLVSGAGSDHNSNFSIATGSDVLTLNKSVDYEKDPKLYVRIRATDAGGLTVEKAFIINVIDVNEPPEALVLSPKSFNENDGQSVSILSVTDPDKNAQYSYSMSAGTGDDDNGSFNLIDNKLKPNAPLDYETKNLYKVRIRAWDGTFEKTEAFTISVIDVNEAPDSIVLPIDTVMDNMGPGYTIAQFLTYDQDAGDTHDLSIVEGAENFIIDNSAYLITRKNLLYNQTNPSANLYPIRVKATDKGGASLTVDFTIRVVPFMDEDAPEILDFDNNPTYISEDADSIVLSIKTTDDQKLDTVHFYYRPIRSDKPFMIHENPAIKKVSSKLFIVEAPLSTNIMDEMGVEYYFKVADAAGNADSTAVGYAYRSFSSVAFTPVNGTFNGDMESYTVIANPYAIKSNKVTKVFADYGSSSKNSWRLFEFTNNASKEIGNATSAVIAQGKGYWFNKVASLSQPITFDNAGVPQNNRRNEHTMKLKKGWNLIGNPYPFELSWNDVLSYNGLTNGQLTSVYKYKNGSYQSGDNRIRVFEGGFVFAKENITIKIPVVKNAVSGGRIAAGEENEGGWSVDLTLENSEHKNTLPGFGMHTDASDSYDRYDLPGLPVFMKYMDISFDHPEHFAKTFARDIAALQDDHIWEFRVLSNMDADKTKLSWKINHFTEHDKRLILYDIVANKAIDMTGRSEYSFTLDRQAAFKVIYGSASFVDGALENIIARSLPAYPNPFTDRVSLPVTLPYSNDNYDIDWEVFDIYGNRVYNRQLKGVNYGKIELNWEIDNIQHIKKGMYIYKVKISNAYMSANFHGRIIKN